MFALNLTDIIQILISHGETSTILLEYHPIQKIRKI